jgi:hypothetical protein
VAVREGLAEWVPIPGARNAHLCTFINKPSLVTSNAFVLRTPFEIVVIDPGASEEQKDRINQILTELVSRRPRPVLVLLTHCHHDHSCHAGSIEAAGGMVKRMAHIVAVEALHRRDPILTVAELYPGAQICNARFDFCVFDSKIEAGRMELQLESFALAPLIAEVVRTIEPLAAKNANQVAIKCDGAIGTHAGRPDATTAGDAQPHEQRQ